MAETNSFTWKDLLTIALSTAALLLSSVAAYYNFFRQVNDVQVRIADFNIENKLKPDEDRVITHLAFINRGNQPALVTAVEWTSAPDVSLKDGSFGGPCQSAPETFPFVLEKGQMKLVSVFSLARDVANQRGPLVHYGIKIASISSHGNDHGAQLFFGTVTLEQSKIKSWKFDRASIDLFGNADVGFRTTH